MTLSDNLDLDLAWRKTKRNLDRNKKIFINNPHITDIIEENKEEFLENLSQKVDEGYGPTAARVVDFPKKDWNIRPASVLKISDAVIYSAILIGLYSDIRDEIQWSAQDRRFSRILLDDIDSPYWMKNSFNNWKKWNEESQELCQDYDYVVSTDIASYFENIEHHILYSYLREINDRKPLRDLLWDCLSRWNLPKSRGLPQGYYPSNILSELYLNKIDKRIKYMGYMHTRYSDDLKIYCDNKDEAIKILEKLSSLYQKKGLYLNKQKTEILTSNEAIQKFVDPRKEIKQINPKIVDKIRHERKERREKIEAKKRDSREIGDGSSDIPYTDGGEIGELDLDIEEETTLLETVFEKRIINSDEDNKSLFKYLVRNLGDLDSEFAVPYCINRIRNGKTQIRHIVDKYFSKLSNKEEIADKLLDYVLKDELHYEFQKFIIVRWFFESKINTEKIRYGMRELLETPHEINEIENYIIAYFGNHGNKTDIEILSEKYTTATSNVQKSVILFAIRKMDPELRGRIYNRAENDHPYCKFSVALGKQSTD